MLSFRRSSDRVKKLCDNALKNACAIDSMFKVKPHNINRKYNHRIAAKGVECINKWNYELSKHQELTDLYEYGRVIKPCVKVIENRIELISEPTPPTTIYESEFDEIFGYVFMPIDIGEERF